MSNNTIQMAKLTLEFEIVIVLWVEALYSTAGWNQWRSGFEEDESSRICIGNKASCQVTFFSKEVRHLGTCPQLVVGMVHFLTHLAMYPGAASQHTDFVIIRNAYERGHPLGGWLTNSSGTIVCGLKVVFVVFSCSIWWLSHQSLCHIPQQVWENPLWQLGETLNDASNKVLPF